MSAKHGKRYRANLEKVDRERSYSPNEAFSILKSFEPAKFAETVEVHIRTGLNVRHAEEQLRGTISLPHGLGKEMTVAVFAKGDKAREATEAGADHVGDDDLAKKIEEGFTDFDVAIGVDRALAAGETRKALARERLQRRVLDLNEVRPDLAARRPVDPEPRDRPARRRRA